MKLSGNISGICILIYIGDFPKRNLCDVLVSFFNTIYFKLFKIGRGPQVKPEKNFLIDSYKLNLWGSLKSVITEAFLPCL